MITNYGLSIVHLKSCVIALLPFFLKINEKERKSEGRTKQKEGEHRKVNLKKGRTKGNKIKKKESKGRKKEKKMKGSNNKKGNER